MVGRGCRDGLRADLSRARVQTHSWRNLHSFVVEAFLVPFPKDNWCGLHNWRLVAVKIDLKCPSALRSVAAVFPRIVGTDQTWRSTSCSRRRNYIFG